MSAPSKSGAPSCNGQPTYADQRVHPATVVHERGSAVFEGIVKRLAEAERAYAILRDKGYGKPWMPLDEIANHVPEKREA